MHGRLFWLWGLLLLVMGCQPGATAAEVVRPEAPDAGDVVADTVPCRDPGSYAEPLIVDWSSSGRLDLEVAMKRGVAVVAYDCDELRLLNGCHLPARYAFAGVTMKEEVIQLANADEVSANLPLSGVKLAASMDATSSLDLALVMVGKRSTALSAADKSMLEGSCEGATHFVRAATLGAFAMARGSRGEIQAAADLFGATAGAASRAERNAKTSDGDRDACQQSQPEDAYPPPGCGASLRLELVPIADKPLVAKEDEDEGGPKTVAVVSACPAGMTKVEGKCVSGGDELEACLDRDRGACRRLCKRGSAHGCLELGQSEVWDRALPVAQGLKSLQRACDLGSEEGCYRVAWTYYNQFAHPEQHDEAKALGIAKASCARGGASSCGLLAYHVRAAPPGSEPREQADPAAYRRHAQRACDLGSSNWCQSLARLLLLNPQTEADGFALYRRACEGGAATACKSWGEALRTREDGPGLVEAFTLGCRHGLLSLCGEAAHPRKLSSEGIERRTEVRDALARRGCFEGSDAYACWVLSLWGPQEERGRAARHGCETPFYMDKKARLCADAAYHANKRARRLDIEGCDKGDALACARVATRHYARACEMGKSSACDHLRARDSERYRRLVFLLCEQRPGADKPWCERAEREGMKVPKGARR